MHALVGLLDGAHGAGREVPPRHEVLDDGAHREKETVIASRWLSVTVLSAAPAMADLL